MIKVLGPYWGPLFEEILRNVVCNICILQRFQECVGIAWRGTNMMHWWLVSVLGLGYLSLSLSLPSLPSSLALSLSRQAQSLSHSLSLPVSFLDR